MEQLKKIIDLIMCNWSLTTEVFYIDDPFLAGMADEKPPISCQCFFLLLWV